MRMVKSSISAAELWHNFLKLIENKVSNHVVQTWLRPVNCEQFDGKHVTLEVRDQFFRDWLTDHYLTFLREGLAACAGQKVVIQWKINPDLRAAPDEAAAPAPLAAKATKTRSLAAPRQALGPVRSKGLESAADADSIFRVEGPGRLNQRYLFDRFVCGPSNQFAFAACKAVAENAGLSYNPLFIFGGVGLGKTHLLSAIGHHILQGRPGANVIYISSEQFTNEVINAVLNSKLEEFQRKYRNNCDVILMDDIQLIAGKERTQHEFFHIFNRLYDSQRQIVVTSDKLPHEIPEIEERLRNRFQWGLIADIQPPEIETRVAILRKKAIHERFNLSNDVAFFLARNIRSNVRELEGALVRVMAHASLSHTTVDVDYVRGMLGDIAPCPSMRVSVEDVQRAVAAYFTVRLADIKGKQRQATLLRPRQLAMYLARKYTSASYPELGQRFGNKSHTTILGACTRIGAQLRHDQDLRTLLYDIEQQLATQGT